MTDPTQTEAGAVVERYLAAYNAQDFDGVRAAFADDLQFAHFNRDFQFSRADDLVDVLRAFAADMVPDRRLGPALRMAVSGETVYREQMWTGTLKVAVPTFGEAGDSVNVRLASVFTVRDGRIVEYYDYG